jgi:muramoyltetrapeptide carboxypeptidase
LTLAELKASPKWLVGFSDISTLHGLLNRAGVMSIHGIYIVNGQKVMK